MHPFFLKLMPLLDHLLLVGFPTIHPIALVISVLEQILLCHFLVPVVVEFFFKLVELVVHFLVLRLVGPQVVVV